MSEIESLTEDLRHAWSGDPWFGPSLAMLLEGVTAAQAAERPIPGAHTIRELVHHLAAWADEVTRRLAGSPPEMPRAGDWPTGGTDGDAEWPRARAELDRAHAALLAALRRFPPERLDVMVGSERDRPLGAGYSYRRMIQGLAEHDAYHAGQIALLKKIAAAPPATGD
jgi:uncharacterized damage-inducible protein DinB